MFYYSMIGAVKLGVKIEKNGHLYFFLFENQLFWFKTKITFPILNWYL